jgi:7-cyano-7-deazaguanine synthase
MKAKSIVHLLSGGLDSVTWLYDAIKQGYKVHCAMIDYKQRHVQELNFAKGHCHRLGVMFTTYTLPQLGGLTEASWIVPGRNAIMLSLAANLAVQMGPEWDTITIGCNAEDEAEFPDCRMAFIQSFNMMLLAAHTPIEVEAPYQQWSKKRIASRAKELGVPLHEIWTCYVGGLKPCRKCPACKKLEAALCGQ